MAREFRYTLVFLMILILVGPVFAQEKNFNPFYEPISVVKRLSYDNYKNIKLLSTAIYNYGGGETEVDKLVDPYAEASALYFANQMVESANLFSKNEKDIQDSANKIARRYKEETEKLVNETIKLKVKTSIKMSMQGKKVNPNIDDVLGAASYSLNQANDAFVRARPVDSMYYYRRAKDSCFRVYKMLGVPLPDKYNKDIVDNQNKVYVSKEKDK